MIFLASPYSAPTPALRQRRYEVVRDAAFAMIQNGEWAFSPIVYCHEIAVHQELPKDAAFWLNFNMHMLEQASSLAVLMLPGWDTSVGIAEEIIKATKLGLSIEYINPETLLGKNYRHIEG